MKNSAHSLQAQPRLRPLSVSIFLMLASGAGITHAQDTAAEPAQSLPEVTVSSSGLALGVSEMTTPVSEIEGVAP